MRKLFYPLQFICLFALVFSVFTPVAALPTDDDKAIRYDSIYYAPNDTTKCTNNGEINELPSEIPQPYRGLFPEAAEEYDTDLSLLTFVFFWENRGFPPPDTDWPTSDAEAEGPFQFRPHTWDGYGVDGDGDGDKDVQDVVDATYGAANFLSSLEGTSDNPLGSVDSPYEEGTLVYAMGAYNFGPDNMKNQKSLPDETQNYVTRGESFINDLRSGIVNLDTNSGSGGAGESQTANADTPKGCGGLGVGEDLVFPLKTTKQAIQQGSENNGGELQWCYEDQTNCHSSPGADDLYKAADIFVEPGTETVAATGGTVIRVNPGGSSLSIKIRGENDNYYFYQHMRPHSEQVNENDSVEAGDILGEIGESSAAEGTAPHLHFDVATEDVGISRECVQAGNCDYEKSVMIDAQPELVEAYEELPEE